MKIWNSVFHSGKSSKRASEPVHCMQSSPTFAAKLGKQRTYHETKLPHRVCLPSYRPLCAFRCLDFSQIQIANILNLVSPLFFAYTHTHGFFNLSAQPKGNNSAHASSFLALLARTGLSQRKWPAGESKAGYTTSHKLLRQSHPHIFSVHIKTNFYYARRFHG